MSIVVFIIYFMFGMIAALAAGAFPLLYYYYSYDEEQVAFLITLSMIASVFQPLIILCAKKIKHQVTLVMLLLLLIAISCVLMFVTSNFIVVAFAVLLFFIARNSIFPVFDSFTITQNVTFAKVRVGSSLGYGVAMSILIVIMQIFTFDERFIAFYTLLVTVVGLVFLATLNKGEVNSTTKIKVQKTQLLTVVLLILFNLFYYGFVTLRLSYQTPYLVEMGFSPQFISYSTIVLVSLEVILMPLYPRLFGRFNKVTLLLWCNLIVVVQMLSLLLYPTTIVIISSLLLHGLQMAIFIPTFGVCLSQYLSESRQTVGFIISTTVQSIGVGIINGLIISNVYEQTKTTISVNNIILVMYLLALLPISLLVIKHYLIKRNET